MCESVARCGLQRVPDLLRCARNVDVTHSEMADGVDDRIVHRWRRSDWTRLANRLVTTRIE